MKPFKKCKWLRLIEGPADGTELEIAPMSLNLYAQGARYFRMPDTRSLRGDGDEGGSYLWSEWVPQKSPQAQTLFLINVHTNHSLC